MLNARRYTPTNTRIFTTIVRYTYGIWLRYAYNIEVRGLETIRKLEAPFVLVGNHTNILDPFILNTIVPHPIHWVTSDGNMRTPLMRFLLLKLVGSIPKSKAIPDIETVNWIVEVIRKKKGVVGLFPEGQASWDGRSMPSFPATAKLLKILKAPVLLGKTSGGYLSLPRWSRFRRKGRIILDFSILFTPEELKSSHPDTIFAKLESGLAHDDTIWQRQTGERYLHPRRAENLELALYMCPSCLFVETMRSAGNRFFCENCGLEREYDSRGHLVPIFPEKTAPDSATSDSAPKDSVQSCPGATERTVPDHRGSGSSAPGIPETVPDWETWQKSAFRTFVLDRAAAPGDLPILSGENITLSRGWRMERMRPAGTGLLALYADRLEFVPQSGATISFAIHDIEGPGVLKKNLFEFYVEKSVYRVGFPNLSRTGRSWVAALDFLETIDSPKS